MAAHTTLDLGDVRAEEEGVKRAGLYNLSTPTVKNIGSTARDVCAIERNFLSHIRLGLLLSLLSSAILLHARLSGRSKQTPQFDASSIPLGCLYFVASVGAISIGWWTYEASRHDLDERKAFVGGFRLHEIVMGSIAMLVAATCLYLISTHETK